MTARESLMQMYKAEIQCLRAAYLKKKDNNNKINEIIADK